MLTNSSRISIDNSETGQPAGARRPPAARSSRRRCACRRRRAGNRTPVGIWEHFDSSLARASGDTYSAPASPTIVT